MTLVVLAVGCTSDDATPAADVTADNSAVPTDSAADEVSTSPPTTAGATASTTPARTTTSTVDPVVDPDVPLEAGAIVAALAADELVGRDNGTPGSLAAQQLLIAQLAQFAQPAYPDRAGADGFVQHFDVGTNLLAVVPGGELANEYVVIGAHYDHLGDGSGCNGKTASDSICNGATDDAAGVAAAITVARAIAAAGVPRRSVLIALWDAEEDGLLGSEAYVADPLIPTAQTIGYLNFDIQGSNLLPSLRNTTVMVGAETGGATLVDAARRATEASTLDTVGLSLLFGQGRSDHATFVAAGVPSVFFTDANGPCYHTVGDDIDVVDLAKLDQQIATAGALATELIDTATPPVYDPSAPGATYDDAVSMLAVVSRGQPEFGRFSSAAEASSNQFLADLQAIVDAGPAAFGDESVGVLLGGSVGFVEALTDGECDGFIG